MCLVIIWCYLFNFNIEVKRHNYCVQCILITMVAGTGWPVYCRSLGRAVQSSTVQSRAVQCRAVHYSTTGLCTAGPWEIYQDQESRKTHLIFSSTWLSTSLFILRLRLSSSGMILQPGPRMRGQGQTAVATYLAHKRDTGNR